MVCTLWKSSVWHPWSKVNGDTYCTAWDGQNKQKQKPGIRLYWTLKGYPNATVFRWILNYFFLKILALPRSGDVLGFKLRSQNVVNSGSYQLKQHIWQKWTKRQTCTWDSCLKVWTQKNYPNAIVFSWILNSLPPSNSSITIDRWWWKHTQEAT